VFKNVSRNPNNFKTSQKKTLCRDARRWPIRAGPAKVGKEPCKSNHSLVDAPCVTTKKDPRHAARNIPQQRELPPKQRKPPQKLAHPVKKGASSQKPVPLKDPERPHKNFCGTTAWGKRSPQGKPMSKRLLRSPRGGPGGTRYQNTGRS